MCSFFARELVSLSKLGVYFARCASWGPQAGSIALWLQPWENSLDERGQRARLLPFVINSGAEIHIPITLTFSLKKSSLSHGREARLSRFQVLGMSRWSCVV